MLNGTLDKYTGFDCTIKSIEDARPYHAKHFPIPNIHEPTLKKF